MKWLFAQVFIISFLSLPVVASENSFDPLLEGHQMEKLTPPIIDDLIEDYYHASTQSSSNLLDILPTISNVKSQGSRNVCTVFALTAVLESEFIKAGGSNRIDLSEEWLQYLVSITSPSGGGNGSFVPRNYNDVKTHGISQEEFMPYTGNKWSTKSTPQLVRRYCSGLSGKSLTRCLNGKRSPTYLRLDDSRLQSLPGGEDFIEARNSARAVKQGYTRHLRGGVVGRTSDIKSLLRAGHTLTLEIDIYYGAWNISNRYPELNIYSDSKSYSKGIVSYPEVGSMDRTKSRSKPARHAVQIIGYDNNVEVTYKRRMRDGSIKSFTRKGVYYFKNSWGTARFGKSFRYKGKRIPGLGMITQDYANEMGQFFSVRYNKAL